LPSTQSILPFKKLAVSYVSCARTLEELHSATQCA